MLFADPTSFLHGDADVEAGSDGWDDTTAYGYDHVVDDPAMDWSASATAAEWWGTIPASRSWRRPKRRYAWRG